MLFKIAFLNDYTLTIEAAEMNVDKWTVARAILEYSGVEVKPSRDGRDECTFRDIKSDMRRRLERLFAAAGFKTEFTGV